MQPWTQRGWEVGSRKQNLQPPQGLASWERDSRIQRTGGGGRFLFFLPKHQLILIQVPGALALVTDEGWVERGTLLPFRCC